MKLIVGFVYVKKCNRKRNDDYVKSQKLHYRIIKASKSHYHWNIIFQIQRNVETIILKIIFSWINEIKLILSKRSFLLSKLYTSISICFPVLWHKNLSFANHILKAKKDGILPLFWLIWNRNSYTHSVMKDD